MSMTGVILSGGMDSTVALALALNHSMAGVEAITFDYGQRHAVELVHAERIANHYGVPWRRVDLSGLAAGLPSSALTNTDLPLPDIPYDGPTMDQTVVPLRNAVFLSVAAGIVAAHGGGTVVAGMHAADHAVYPDCRPVFVSAMQTVIYTSLDGVAVRLWVPFMDTDKSGIVTLGASLGAPLDLTWSCYAGGAVHCGICGTCRERRRAFADAGVDDPTTYAP